MMIDGKQQRFVLCRALGLSVVALWSIAGFAMEGKFVFLEGQVDRVSSGKSEPAKVGSVLKAGDTCKTQEKSMAIVALEDGSELKINQNSELTLSPTPSSGVREVVLHAGSVFSKIQKQRIDSKKLLSHFFVRTRSAVMGVRGTLFFTAYSKKAESSPDDLWMCVKEGSVEVEALKQASKVLVHAGEGVSVLGGQKITPPQAYTWTNDLNWNLNPKSGSVSNQPESTPEGQKPKKTWNAEYDGIF